VVGYLRCEVGLLSAFPRAAALLGAAALLAGCRGASARAAAPAAAPTPLPVAVRTEPAGEDADDPAIWVNRAAPADSRVFATNKVKAPGGALVAYDLAGRVRQRIDGLDRPNNVDVEYGFRLGGVSIDIAVLTERYQRRLRAFRVGPDGALTDVSSLQGLRVFEGEPGGRGAPMGVALYRRPADGVVFAFVSRKESPPRGTVWQYRLEDDGRGRVRAVKARELGTVEPGSEVEAIAVDDPLGSVYYAEEPRAFHEWAADPDDPRAGVELARFGQAGFRGDREGIAVYATPDGGGFLLTADQVPGGSRYFVFRRGSGGAAPRDHALVKMLAGGADDTDGLDATSEPLGPAFPNGLVVAMNSGGRNFFFYRPEDLGLETLAESQNTKAVCHRNVVRTRKNGSPRMLRTQGLRSAPPRPGSD
jgi:3-phytase